MIGWPRATGRGRPIIHITIKGWRRCRVGGRCAQIRFPSRPFLEPDASIHLHTPPSPRQRAKARRPWSGFVVRSVRYPWLAAIIHSLASEGGDNVRVLICGVGKMHTTIFAWTPPKFSQHSSILRRYSLLMKVKDCPVACAHGHHAIFAPDAVNYEQVSNYGFQGGAPSGSF